MPWTYEAALDYLYSFIDYEVKREVRYAPEVMSLDRPSALLRGLGDPQADYVVIHVTGTKGKGSVGAYCYAALEAAGLRAGLYSSPHLQDFRERFRADDALMPKAVTADLLAEIKPVADQIEGLTWFEITTALALLYFSRQGLDAVVTEVGLGGRLDATNVITPAVSVITSLSYDHMHLLGNTLAEIAAEKAGIIKPGVPVVSAPQEPEAEAVLRRIAAERGAPLTVVGQDWQYEIGATDRCGQSFRAALTGQPLAAFWTPLIGHHQATNAVVALATLDAVRQAGLALPPETIATGLRQVNWPGRFEIIGEQPALVLDAAHNGASATCLRETLRAVFPDASPLTVVFGASADKDVRGMFSALLPAVDHLLLVQAVHPRALSPDELAEHAAAVGFSGTVERLPIVAEALQRAQALAGANGVIVVTGSLFVVGEARDVLGLPPGQAVTCTTPKVTDVQTFEVGT